MALKILRIWAPVWRPAAAFVIANHLKDMKRQPEDYDRIITGDLGTVGQKILFELMGEEGYDIRKVHMDCRD